MKFLFVSILITLSAFLRAQLKLELRPIPQSVTYIGGEAFFPAAFKLKTKNVSQNLSEEMVKEFGGGINGMRLVLAVRKPKAEAQKEGYTLTIGKKEISVTGNDERGLFYGILTLKQILAQTKSNGKLPLLEIVDFPDVPYRGVVEGFYGTPWSFDSRMRQIAFYGENKLNTYIYAPKDDPYHSSPNWRKAYPEAEALNIKKLINQSAKHHVDFVWAIHPGQDIQWNDADRVALLNKFSSMYELGVRSFAVFFDDIYGEGTRPEKQAELLNYIVKEFVEKNSGVNPLIMCPTEYNKAWSDPKKRYLKTLGEKLHPSIQIMWTGDKVIGDVSESSADWFKDQTGRNAFFWWNFPVSDYVRDHLLMGRAYGLDSHSKNKISGLVSNPMEHAEASKPAIYSVAQFAWNMDHYDSDKTWREGLRLLMPKNYEALQVFANHNSDAGQNGHRYRREESEAFLPVAERFTNSLRSAVKNSDSDNVAAEFQKIISSADVLLASYENPSLLSEIRPWVIQLQNLAHSGLSVLELYDAYFSGNKTAFVKAHADVLDWEKKMYAFGADPKINPNRPGLRPGSLVLKPLVENIFNVMTQQYNARYGTKLSVYSRFSPHKIFTDIPKLDAQPLVAKDASVEISPVLEPLVVAPNNYFGMELEKVSEYKKLLIDLQNNEFEKAFSVESSTDGTTWNRLTGARSPNSTQWISENKGKAKYIRIRNIGNLDKTIRLNEFRIIF